MIRLISKLILVYPAREAIVFYIHLKNRKKKKSAGGGRGRWGVGVGADLGVDEAEDRALAQQQGALVHTE